MFNKRATQFRDLHKPGNPFVLANAWDAGSAKVLSALGAQAIGTTSAGHAFTLGRPDMGSVTRDEALAHAQDIVAATQLPVSADLENGYGDDPETVAQTVRLAAEIGLAGCSIEDTQFPGTSPYNFDLAAERIKAAAAAARSLPHDFVLVARADGIMNGHYDIEEALRRLLAFEDAGADCLYIPLPPDAKDLSRICATVDRPVNALAAGPKYTKLTVADFGKLGVARISIGSALAKLCQQTLLDAAGPMLGHGDFRMLGHAAKGSVIDGFLNQ